LIARILSGERDLYRELVEEHQADIYRLCRAVLADPHEAEEAAQTAFIKAYRSLASFRMGSSFRTWVTRIALNCCKDRLRQRKRRRFLSLDLVLKSFKRLPENLVNPVAGETEETRIPRIGWEALSEGERAVLELLVSRPGIAYEQIGRELGLSLNSVKGRLKRARIKLRSLRDKPEGRME
jgi:RNA polymerase sigma-70 factor (ECF subfamily)